MKNNVKVFAVNCENTSGFNIYLDFSGRREYVMSHRHNGLLYQVMKDGIHLNELMRKKPHRIFPKYGIQYYGTTSAKAERQLNHVIRVIEDYIGNSNYEQEEAA